MKKNFVKSRWLFTMLLFVTTMIMPSMMLAQSITPTTPKGKGTAEEPYQISTAAELYWFAGLVNGTLKNGGGKGFICQCKTHEQHYRERGRS